MRILEWWPDDKGRSAVRTKDEKALRRLARLLADELSGQEAESPISPASLERELRNLLALTSDPAAIAAELSRRLNRPPGGLKGGTRSERFEG